jgi:hypothetical protein
VGSASPAVKALLDDALLDEMVARMRGTGRCVEVSQAGAPRAPRAAFNRSGPATYFLVNIDGWPDSLPTVILEMVYSAPLFAIEGVT